MAIRLPSGENRAPDGASHFSDVIAAPGEDAVLIAV